VVRLKEKNYIDAVRGSNLADRLFDTATRAIKRPFGRVAPAGQRCCGEARLSGFRFSFVEESGAPNTGVVRRFFLRPAMFADPAKGSIDEMIRLDHKKLDVKEKMPEKKRCWMSA